jgi:hypothetical protein
MVGQHPHVIPALLLLLLLPARHTLTCSNCGGGDASGMRSASCAGSSKGSSSRMVWRMLQQGQCKCRNQDHTVRMYGSVHMCRACACVRA